MITGWIIKRAKKKFSVNKIPIHLILVKEINQIIFLIFLYRNNLKIRSFKIKKKKIKILKVSLKFKL